MDPASEPADEQLSVRSNHAVVPLEIGRVISVEFLLAGNEHAKFMRQIFVSVDITAPLYWWKEFDTSVPESFCLISYFQKSRGSFVISWTSSFGKSPMFGFFSVGITLNG